ncbi:hypothetical protein THRCLA_02718 [Thraustotheca clavata]|uniref:Cilia-and flagella-associated protein 96 n=1 Tax=Thraustotheca clavata TaxID=74557 RepID=A0A1W0A4E1_9STRA|nr:hypothetical protein THRCLA_02718 [Thraustotheca clavata]
MYNLISVKRLYSVKLSSIHTEMMNMTVPPDQETAVRRELPIVLRVLGKHFDPKSPVKIDGPAEKGVADRHFAIGRQRAFFGIVAGGAAGFGVWKVMKSQRKGFGVFMTGACALAGAIYGISSIREEFFLDLLSIPEEQSEFARNCRDILHREMPQSVILHEVHRRMGVLGNNSGILQNAWEDTNKVPETPKFTPTPIDEEKSATDSWSSSSSSKNVFGNIMSGKTPPTTTTDTTPKPYDAWKDEEYAPTPSASEMLFYSFFKTLLGKEVAVELKNDVALVGTLHSVDQYLNFKLIDVTVVESEKYPQLMNMKNCFIRGSVVRYIQIAKADVDTELLQDAARREASANKNGAKKSTILFLALAENTNAAMTTRDGNFDEPGFVTIGDQYKDPAEPKVHFIAGRKQFLTNGPKPGQTGSNWGPGPRKFVGMSGQYQERYKEEAKIRLENTKKYLKPSGFTYSSHTKKSTGPGDYNGSFHDPKNQESVEPPAPLPRSNPNPKERQFERRNVLTSPSKKGTLGYTGTLIGGKGITAMPAEFDSVRQADREAMKRHKDKMGEKKAFKLMSHPVDFFDTNDHVAASRVFECGEDCKKRPPEKEESMNPKERAQAHAATYKSWKPSHAGKEGEAGVFEKFPERTADPYDERVVSRAMLPNRRNPVEVATQGLPESIRERKSFKPSNCPKKKFTPSTVLLGINKHKL